MKRVPIIIITLLFIFSVQVANAMEPKESTFNFFKMVQSGKIPEAYDMLFKGSPIPAKKPQAMDVLKGQTASALPLYGSIIGVELFREEKIGDSIIRLVFILKAEMCPTVWEFFFYKPKSDWFLANIRFNDEFDKLYSIN